MEGIVDNKEKLRGRRSEEKKEKRKEREVENDMKEIKG